MASGVFSEEDPDVAGVAELEIGQEGGAGG